MATSKPSGTKRKEPATDFSTNTTAKRRMNMQRMQNMILVWLDNDINENNADCSNTINQLEGVVNNINRFTNSQECVKFIQTNNNNKICMVISDSLGQQIVPHIHNMSQVDTILIFCNNQECHKQWAKEWSKIKGVFTDITSICQALKQAAHECEQNAISINIVAQNNKLDQLDPSFMYTQILKEILLGINFEDKHFQEFITYCREVYNDNEHELENVNQLQATYKNNIPIWWYTWDAFLYRMFNQALRTMDVDIIVRMGFFIKDLHQDIQRLHSEQFNDDQSSKAFTVYRGQDLSKEDLTKMTNNKGGLVSFNNFLSTSENRDVSFNFIQQTATNADHVRILFVISINPSSSTTPFASITDISYFHTKDEVLFSMHTIFRIGDIKSINGNNDLYEVNLTLTNENDQDLLTLTDYIRQETFPDKEGWFRLGSLLIKMGQFNKAQEVYEVLLHQTTDESGKASIYHQLGIIKDDQGEYQEALPYFEKSLAIFQKTHPSNHHRLGTSYNNIGLVYHSMGDYPKALSSHEKAITIRQQSLPPNNPDLGASYNNIGMVYDSMGDYPKALSYYEKALEIQRESLPPNHPDLTASYNNIGIVYHSMGEYPKAFLSHEKALAMKRQSLSSNRFDWSMTYNNLGNLHNSMGNHPVALSFYEKALAIRQQSLPPNHPSLGTSYNNIGLVYYNVGDYPKALSNYEKDLTILQESVPSYHPDLGDTCNKIGTVYEKMSDYSKAHSFYERAVQIGQQSLPINHPNLEIYRRNLEDIKKKL